MTTRIITAGLLLAAALFIAPSAQAAQSLRPGPDTEQSSSVTQPRQGERPPVSLAERRLIHHDLIQVLLDGEG